MKAILTAALHSCAELAPRLIFALLQSCVVPQGAGDLIAVALHYVVGLMAGATAGEPLPAQLFKALLRRVQA